MRKTKIVYHWARPVRVRKRSGADPGGMNVARLNFSHGALENTCSVSTASGRLRRNWTPT